MTRPRLLDLFCGAGGAAVGYHRAGFDVVGVDNRPQPRYPFEFVQADAFEFLRQAWRASEAGGPYALIEFDVIHASPPCHDHTPLTSVAGTDGTDWMLAAIRECLMKFPCTWVIENVSAADMRADFVLCGSMFGLRTYRHRRFEIDPRLPILLAPPLHPPHSVPTATKNRRARWDEGWNVSITGDVGTYLGSAAMGISWMTGDELSQAIPPAYTEYIGAQLLEHLKERAA